VKTIEAESPADYYCWLLVLWAFTLRLSVANHLYAMGEIVPAKCIKTSGGIYYLWTGSREF